jgi:hypothetical protein
MFPDLSGANAFFTALTNRELWLRIGIGALGFGLCVAGLYMIVLGDKRVQGAIGTATKAGISKTPVGVAAVTASEALNG